MFSLNTDHFTIMSIGMGVHKQSKQFYTLLLSHHPIGDFQSYSLCDYMQLNIEEQKMYDIKKETDAKVN